MSHLLIAGVQMNTQSDDRCDEGIAFYSMEHHVVKPVIVKDTIIDPFGTGTLSVYLFVLLSAPSYRCIEPDVPFRFCIDNTAICRL